MNKDQQKLNKQIANIIDKHSVDTTFTVHRDEIGYNFDIILQNLMVLEINAELGKIKDWGNLKIVSEAMPQIEEAAKNLCSPSIDAKQSAKYMPLLDTILNQATLLSQTIRTNNSIDTCYEVAIADRILEEIHALQDQEKESYNYLRNAITPDKLNFFANHIEGDDFMLLNHLMRVESLCEEISKLKAGKYQSQLDALQKEANKQYDTLSKDVIKHYDELNKYNAKINKNDRLIKGVDVDKLKAKYDNNDPQTGL